jgi:hypothetical protein
VAVDGDTGDRRRWRWRRRARRRRDLSALPRPDAPRRRDRHADPRRDHRAAASAGRTRAMGQRRARKDFPSTLPAASKYAGNDPNGAPRPNAKFLSGSCDHSNPSSPDASSSSTKTASSIRSINRNSEAEQPVSARREGSGDSTASSRESRRPHTRTVIASAGSVQPRTRPCRRALRLIRS